jgi:hypothetical protein
VRDALVAALEQHRALTKGISRSLNLSDEQEKHLRELGYAE